MKNLIVLFALNCYINGFSQILFTTKDTLRFTADSSYARAIVRYNNELVFGTSKTGVISYNEQTKVTKTLISKNIAGEFRDLAVYKGKLYAMISGNNGIIYKYTKQKTKIIFHKDELFLDDIILSKNKLFLLGDPINNHFYLTQLTVNKKKSDELIMLSNQQEEACYAASGTTACLLSKARYCFVSGGLNSARFHNINWQAKTVESVELPMSTGIGAGPFSIFFQTPLTGAIVGGNYLQPSNTGGTACFTIDGGKTWNKSETSGYRSCVTGNKKLLVACGTNGIDYSLDGGAHWEKLDNGNFCALMLEKNRLYATTNKGYCIVYQLINSFNSMH